MFCGMCAFTGLKDSVLIKASGIILMSKSSIEGVEADLYRDEDWGKVRTSILKQYYQADRENLVSDQLLIQQQSDLLQEIIERIKRSKAKESLANLQVLPIDSSISNISSHYNYGDDESLIKSKFTQQFESGLVNSALKEVKANCSDQTYETMRNYVVNNKQKQFENLSKTVDKKTKEIEELSLLVIIKQNQLVKLKEEFVPLLAKAEFFEDEKRKWKKKNDTLMEKEILLHKLERTLIFKQKMHQQAKKRGEKLKEFTDSIYSKMKQIEGDLNELRMKIESQMQRAQTIKCCDQFEQQVCWKKEIMKKYRQKLLQERNILKDEEKHLEKRYQTIDNISQQCKKLVGQSYEGLMSTINSGGASSNRELSEKGGPLSMLQKKTVW